MLLVIIAINRLRIQIQRPWRCLGRPGCWSLIVLIRLLYVADVLQDLLGLGLGDPFFALTACVLEQGALKRADTSFRFLALRLLQYDVLDLGLLGVARMA